MTSRTKEVQEATSAARVAQQPDQAPQADVNAQAPAMSQAGGVRVPPVVGSLAGVLRIQQLKGNWAVSQMLAVQQSEEAQGLRGPSDEEIHSAAAEGIRTPSTTLPYLDRIQASFGRHSIGHVKAHVGAEATQASQAMGALAFASGHHVVFGGTPDLRTAAHEAAHIVQQQTGVQLVGGIGREGDAYERHADSIANSVVAGRSAEGLLDSFAPSTSISEFGPSAKISSREVESLKEPIQRIIGGSYEQVTKRHKENLKFAKESLESARSSKDSTLRRSVEWLNGKDISVYAITETHDAKKRAKMQGQPPKKLAYFGKPKSSVVPNEAGPEDPYKKDDMTSRDNIVFAAEGIRGLNFEGNAIALIEPIYFKSSIFETIKHEVQHSADRHHSTDDNIDSSWSLYQTEFRAYSIENKGLDNRDLLTKTLFDKVGVLCAKDYTWDKRQWDIFRHIYHHYGEIEQAWDRECGSDKNQRTFQKRVVGLKETNSVNPINSLKIESFYKAATFHEKEILRAEANELDAGVKSFLSELVRMEPEEIRYVMSSDYYKKMNKHVKVATFNKLTTGCLTESGYSVGDSPIERLFLRDLAAICIGPVAGGNENFLAQYEPYPFSPESAKYLLGTVHWKEAGAIIKEKEEAQATLVDLKARDDKLEELIKKEADALGGDGEYVKNTLQQLKDFQAQPCGRDLLEFLDISPEDDLEKVSRRALAILVIGMHNVDDTRVLFMKKIRNAAEARTLSEIRLETVERIKKHLECRASVAREVAK